MFKHLPRRQRSKTYFCRLSNFGACLLRVVQVCVSSFRLPSSPSELDSNSAGARITSTFIDGALLDIAIIIKHREDVDIVTCVEDDR